MRARAFAPRRREDAQSRLAVVVVVSAPPAAIDPLAHWVLSPGPTLLQIARIISRCGGGLLESKRDRDRGERERERYLIVVGGNCLFIAASRCYDNNDDDDGYGVGGELKT